MAQGSSSFHVSPPPHLKMQDNRVEEWKLFLQMYENYELITELNKKSKEYQKAVFLHTLGPVGLRLYNTLTFDREGEEKDVKVIKEKMSTLIIGRTNETYERFIFNKRDQKPGESIETYIAELRELAKSCKFCECLKDSLIRDRIVLGICDQGTRKVLLQKRDLTLKQAEDICRSNEAATSQLKELGEDPTIHAMKQKSRVEQKKYEPPTASATGQYDGMITCKFCARRHRRKKEECPALGKTCAKCHGRNHFARCCRGTKKKSIKTVSEDPENQDSSSETESVDIVEEIHTSKDDKSTLYTEMLLNGESLKFQIDSGATVNVIPKKFIQTELEPAPIVLKMYNNTTMQAEGRAKLKLRNPKNGKKYNVPFVVVNENRLTPLISRRTAEQMKLITVNYDNFNQLHGVKDNPGDPLIEFGDVFEDTCPGKLPGEVHLSVKLPDGTRPVQCNTKPIPVSMKQRVKDELEKMVQQDILAPVDKPTEWCSRLVVTEKKNSEELRFCIDPRPLNKVLQREIHRLPVMDDVLPELSKAKIFSKLDLKSGYLHCELSQDSSYLTTMNTPFGRYRWKRLPFGLNVSSEIFQKKLLQALSGLEGVECVADDIIIFGVGDTDEEAMENHDKRLGALLQRCREMNIKLNKQKSVLRTPSVTFLGHIVTGEGLKPDPNKVQAILKLPNPTNPTEVQRLQGSVQYLARFLPKLSETFEPLRKLTHKGEPWEWKEEHDIAMAEIKQLLTSAPILSFYDPDKELTIQCDASKAGLGTTLLQEGKPLAYASRALSDTEQRYAQIEKEALAIVFSLERFHQFTFGRHVHVQSDHKPLETIVKKPLHRAPRRLQGMLMRMLHYDIDIQWTKGKDMHIADMLSRAYLPDSSETCDFEEVNIATGSTMSEDKLKELRMHTQQDDNLQVLKTVIMQGWPEEKSLTPNEAKPYFHLRDELSYQNGLLYRGERIVIPVTMRRQMKERLHTSHLGVGSCLRRARECMFWPGMNEEIKTFISTCDACRTYERDNQKETLQPHELPDRPWEKIGADLFELNGKHYLITVDYFSNYWEIDRLHNQTSKMVIKKLKGQFARYGIPSTIITDNGTQFVSEEFIRFQKEWDFDHMTISPRHSQTNGKAESAVKAAKRLLKKCQRSHTDPYMALLEVRNTPQQGLDTSPVQRLHGRRTRTTLPSTDSLLQPKGIDVKEEKRKMKEQQKKQSIGYNKNARDLSILDEGDTVRLKPYKMGDTVWRKAIIMRRLDERSYEIETEEGRRLRRNRKDLKRTEEPFHEQTAAHEHSEDLAPGTQQPKDPEPDPPRRPTDHTTDTPQQPKQSHTEQQPQRKEMSEGQNKTLETNKHKQNEPQGKETQNRRTRSGREVRKPKALQDFVK